MTSVSAPGPDDVVNSFIVRKFRGEGPYFSEEGRHLSACESTRVDVHGYGLTDDTYGCDTGCEFARLEAGLVCDHDFNYEFSYGTFGDISYILAEIFGE